MKRCTCTARNGVRLWREGCEVHTKPKPIPADDTAQIDDQVQDVLTTIIIDKMDEWYGVTVIPDGDAIPEIIAQLWKDLASLGIRLTYDTTIGGE